MEYSEYKDQVNPDADKKPGIGQLSERDRQTLAHLALTDWAPADADSQADITRLRRIRDQRDNG